MADFKPTGEQEAIIDAANTGGRVAISAAAGTGKTSTLKLLAGARPKSRMLYIAFNKAVQVEAAASFPANVTCKTAHSLAYKEFGAPMRERMGGRRVPGNEAAKILGIDSAFGFGEDTVFSARSQASMALGMVARFCRSADTEVQARHLRWPEGLTPAQGRDLGSHLLPYARAAWADLSAKSGKLRPTHDTYLKLWQLSKPELTGWDVILYDEAQDASPEVADVVERQGHAQLVAVGDAAQAIYQWRGAGDFLSNMDADHRLNLTQSWRFGQNIADEANVWLGVVGTDLRVRGNPNLDSELAELTQPDTVLCRSNAGTIENLLDAHDASRKVHLVGGGEDMLKLAQAAERMMDGKPPFHPELAAFSTWDQVVEYAKNDPSGTDLAVGVRMIDKYGTDGVQEAIEGCVSEKRAELVVTTAHKAKGREWPKVQIAHDFIEPLDKRTGEPLPIPGDDAMLAYVSVTRAKQVLDNAGLAWVHTHLESLGRAGGETVDREATPPAEAGDNQHPLPTPLSLLPDPAPQPVPVSEEPQDVTTAAGPLARLGLAVGDEMLVAGERDVYRIRGVAPDGSISAYGQGKSGMARNFLPEWCCPAWKEGRAGKRVRVRSVPAAQHRARETWRATHDYSTPPAETDFEVGRISI